jgi:hypothetical protein
MKCKHDWYPQRAVGEWPKYCDKCGAVRQWENPGSDAARKLGCRCATMDNNHGKYPPYPANPERGTPDGWWITEGCPMHAPVPK